MGAGTEVEVAAEEVCVVEVLWTGVVVPTVFDVLRDVDDSVTLVAEVVVDEKTWGVVVLPKHCDDRG